MRRRLHLLALLALLAFALVLPFGLNPFAEGMIVTAMIFVVLAVSWNLLGGFSRLFSFGHAAYFGLGAYATGLLIQAGLPWPLALIAGALGGAAITVPLFLCFRTRGVYFSIITLSVAEALRLTADKFFPGGQNGLSLPLVFPIRSHDAYYVVLVVVVLSVLVSVAVSRSRLGLALAALRSDEIAAASVGVSPLRTKAITLVISAAIAGAAGGLYAITQSYINPETVFGTDFSILPVLMTTLGGMGTIVGPVLGALAWAGVDEFIRSNLSGAYSTIIYGALLLLLATLLTKGLVGEVPRLVRWIRDRLAPAKLSDVDWEEVATNVKEHSR